MVTVTRGYDTVVAKIHVPVKFPIQFTQNP